MVVVFLCWWKKRIFQPQNGLVWKTVYISTRIFVDIEF